MGPFATTATLLVVAAGVPVGRLVTRALRGAAGFTSHTVCTEVFGSGLPLARVIDESIHSNPALRALAPITHIRVDPATASVRVRIAALFASTAIHRGELGSLVVIGAPPAPPGPMASPAPDLDPFPWLADSAPTPTDAAMSAALDRAFAGPGKRHTRAVLVVSDDRIIAERYAPGIGPTTPLLGYSMAKSFTNAMLGVLVRQGRLDVSAPAPVPQWQRPGDPRATITVEHLMRMTSGLKLGESNSGLDDVTRMIYTQRDMAAVAASARLKYAPGSRYEYTSANTLVLSRIIRDLAGGDASAVHDFVHREILDPLAMTTTTLEYDATGTPIGSTYQLASARDWARFGLLYLHDGVVDGRRILPEGWVNYSTSQTLDSEYGAGWRPVSAPPAAERFGLHGLPADAFFAVGFLGQYTVVIPSRRLVIVRLGASYGTIGHVDGIGELVRAAVDASETSAKIG